MHAATTAPRSRQRELIVPRPTVRLHVHRLWCGTSDEFGNLTSYGTVERTTNHLQGAGINYDVAGNQMNGDAYQYDSVNMMSAWLAGGSGRTWFVYTPSDERIASVSQGTN